MTEVEKSREVYDKGTVNKESIKGDYKALVRHSHGVGSDRVEVIIKKREVLSFALSRQ